MPQEPTNELSLLCEPQPVKCVAKSGPSCSARSWQLAQHDPPTVQLLKDSPDALLSSMGEEPRPGLSPVTPMYLQRVLFLLESDIPAQDGGHVKAQLAEYFPVFNFYDLPRNQEQNTNRHVARKQVQERRDSVLRGFLRQVAGEGTSQCGHAPCACVSPERTTGYYQEARGSALSPAPPKLRGCG